MDPIKDSLEFPMVLVIRESRAKSWPQAEMILATVRDSAPYDESLKSYYFVVTKSREHFAKAMAVIDLLGHTKALQVYINGAVAQSNWQLRQIGECFLKATKFDDPRRYCHVVHEHRGRRYSGAGISISLSLFETESSDEEKDQSRMIRRTAVPCRLIYNRISYDIDEGRIDDDGFSVRAISEGVDMCPLFDAGGFAEVFPKMIGKDGQIEDGHEL